MKQAPRPTRPPERFPDLDGETTIGDWLLNAAIVAVVLWGLYIFDRSAPALNDAAALQEAILLAAFPFVVGGGLWLLGGKFGTLRVWIRPDGLVVERGRSIFQISSSDLTGLRMTWVVGLDRSAHRVVVLRARDTNGRRRWLRIEDGNVHGFHALAQYLIPIVDRRPALATSWSRKALAKAAAGNAV